MTSPSAVDPENFRVAADGKSESAALLVVGRLQSPHGVRGWLRFRSFTDDPELALNIEPWLLTDTAGRSQSAELEQYRTQGELFLVKLKGIDDRNAAALMTGKSVQVRADQLPAPGDDEFYWRDLEGMAVCNTAGVALGTVVELFDNGAHDVLVIRDHVAQVSASGEAPANPKERFIPFVDRHVIEVDAQQRLITVDWDEAWD